MPAIVLDHHMRVIAGGDWASLPPASAWASSHFLQVWTATIRPPPPPSPPPLPIGPQVRHQTGCRYTQHSNCNSMLSTANFSANSVADKNVVPTSAGLALPSTLTTLTLPSPTSRWIHKTLSSTCRTTSPLRFRPATRSRRHSSPSPTQPTSTS